VDVDSLIDRWTGEPVRVVPLVEAWSYDTPPGVLIVVRGRPIRFQPRSDSDGVTRRQRRAEKRKAAARGWAINGYV